MFQFQLVGIDAFPLCQNAFVLKLKVDGTELLVKTIKIFCLLIFFFLNFKSIYISVPVTLKFKNNN